MISKGFRDLGRSGYINCSYGLPLCRSLLFTPRTKPDSTVAAIAARAASGVVPARAMSGKLHWPALAAPPLLRYQVDWKTDWRRTPEACNMLFPLIGGAIGVGILFDLLVLHDQNERLDREQGGPMPVGERTNIIFRLAGRGGSSPASAAVTAEEKAAALPPTTKAPPPVQVTPAAPLAPEPTSPASQAGVVVEATKTKVAAAVAKVETAAAPIGEAVDTKAPAALAALATTVATAISPPTAEEDKPKPATESAPPKPARAETKAPVVAKKEEPKMEEPKKEEQDADAPKPVSGAGRPGHGTMDAAMAFAKPKRRE